MNKKLEVAKNDLTVSKLGAIFTKSGLFKDSSGQAQAIVKILAGGEMGLGAVSSMTGIDIIQGRLTLSGNLQAAMIKAHRNYDYRVREHTNTKCSIEFFQWEAGEKESLGTHEFTMNDAKQAGLSGNNWRKYPKAMLFNRCISAGVKVYTPDIFFGLAAYTEGEMPGEGVDTTPEQVDVVQQAVEEASPPPAEEGEAEEVVVEIIEATPEEEATIELNDSRAKDEPPQESSPYYRFLSVCQDHKKRLGERVYYRVLSMNGLDKSNSIGKNEHKTMNKIVEKFMSIPDPPAAEWFITAHASLFAEYADKGLHKEDGLYYEIAKRYKIMKPDDAQREEVLSPDKREEFLSLLEDALKE